MRSILKLWFAATLAVACVLPSTACAEPTEEPDPLFDIFDEETEEDPFSDPFEPVNRAMFRLNAEIDRWVLDPLTIAYRYAVPEIGKRGIHRFLSNINSPVIALNDAMQGEFAKAGIITWRFVVNSTVGVGGIFDPSSALGVEGHRSDFGQTLHSYGIPSGPYLVLPLFGPTTARDSVGSVVDIALRPTTYFLAPADQLVFTTIHGSGSGLSTREKAYDALRILQESSLDYYAALRDAYLQNRKAEVEHE